MSDHPRTITLPAVQLPVLETDVLVAGAGTAGCIAAIAAARQGASVILIEKLPVPGGTYTNGGIGANSLCHEHRSLYRQTSGRRHSL